MRVLFTFVGGEGHFAPLAPIARVVEAAGHELVFGCAPPMVALVEGAGFAARAMGAGSARQRERTPLRPVDRDREDRDLRERFVRRAGAARAPQTLELCEAFAPDVLVCDETDFGAMVAAERLGLPFATVVVNAAGSFVRAEVVGEALGALRAEHGLPPDPALEMLRRHLVLAPFPPAFRDPADPLPATAHHLRTLSPAATPGAAPRWARVLPNAPCAYLTLGTIFNTESGDLLPRLIRGLCELPVNLLATVGRELDPAELGPQPAHVHVERYVPQADVLPHCDLVVSHGGSGSVLGALAHGLPQILIPLGADQPQNAERCVALGVARVLDAIEATPQSVRAEASAVLADRGYRQRAQRIRDQIAALPDAVHAVGLLEALAAERQASSPS